MSSAKSEVNSPILNAPSPAAQKLELLCELFPQAVETAPDGSVRVNAAAIQQALDPANPAGNHQSLAQLIQQIDASVA